MLHLGQTCGWTHSWTHFNNAAAPLEFSSAAYRPYTSTQVTVWLQRNMRVCMGNKVFETLDEINELKAIKVINKV